jgi:hypothetical protein
VCVIKVSKARQPRQTPVLIFISCVNGAYSFIFISVFSYIFIIVVSNRLGIFLPCKMAAVFLLCHKPFHNLRKGIRSMNVHNWKKVAQNRDSWKVVEQAGTLYRL